MKIYVIGGSNSIQKNGWTKTFSEIYPEIVINRSVGASNSLMGYYRATVGMALQPGDVLVWEYALNDQFFCDRQGYSPEDILPHVEALLRLCAAREVVFMPLLLTPQRWFPESEDTPYLRALKALFWHYEVSFVDAKAELNRMFDPSSLQRDLFENANHIRPGSVYAEAIAHAVARSLQTPCIPACASLLYAGQENPIIYGNTFRRGASVALSNRLISVEGFRPDPVVTLEAPATGEVLAILALTSSRGGGFEMRYRYRDMRLSMTADQEDFTKTMLKLIYLPRTLVNPLFAEKGETLDFRWLQKPGRCRADFGLRAMLTEDDMAGRDAAILGCLMRNSGEEVAAPSTAQM